MKFIIFITAVIFFVSVNARRTHNYDYKFENADNTPAPQYKIEDAPRLFHEFIQAYGRKYKTQEEYDYRYQNFVNSLIEINKLNSEKSSATFGINMFADLAFGEDPTVAFSLNNGN
ncbi:counting factor associated protein D-like [Achroia grisella]|uniref:counting factor associated protein D-like n=1 Tax=Achroia grisella TaxID=688607 RepID=UPI0027D2F5C1|nr:counting factor associated protein D-like [Achroia grisella]